MDQLNRSANINIPSMDLDSFDSMCLLTPDTHSTSFSGTPSPLSSPIYRPTTNQDFQIASAFEDQRYQLSGETPYGRSQPSYSLSVPQYNPFHRRASMVVESSPTYTFPRATSSTSSKSKNTIPPLTPAEQEALPSWQRDFDKIQDATTKARWAQELYNDFLCGKIPTTGRAVHDIIDWETCVAKVDGVKDAEATARMLVAAQERKADLQTPAAKLKTSMLDKEPPRRQNKFICYRSLRSSQLAAHFTSFKQSQFSAVTSLEWKEIDTDWWGEVANLVEEVRRAKYVGQLDTKGNALRRGSADSRSEETSPKSRKPKLVEKRNSVSRYDPYGGDRPQRPSLPRATSYLDSPPALLAPPAPIYRHSIDMGTMTGQQYSPVKQEVYEYESTPFQNMSTLPHSPTSLIHHGHGSTYTPSTMDHSLFSDPFAYNQVTPSTPSITNSSPFQTPCGPSSYATQPYYPSPPYSHSTPAYHQPQVYVPQSNWVPHGRGQTNELMEMYTLAQDFVPATGYQQGEAPCFVGSVAGGGNWSSLHPSMSVPLR